MKSSWEREQNCRLGGETFTFGNGTSLGGGLTTVSFLTTDRCSICKNSLGPPPYRG